jgi:hypothetical protein
MLPGMLLDRIGGHRKCLRQYMSLANRRRTACPEKRLMKCPIPAPQSPPHLIQQSMLQREDHASHDRFGVRRGFEVRQFVGIAPQPGAQGWRSNDP